MHFTCRLTVVKRDSCVRICMRASTLSALSRMRRRTDKPYKLVGDWISTSSPNFVAMVTRVGPQHLHDSIESAVPENPLVDPNISGLCAIYKPSW